MKKAFILTVSLFVAAGIFSAVEAKEKAAKTKSAKEIILQKIDFSKGKTVLQAMKDRHSSREFADRPLDMQALSQLLWAAGGINREDSGGRTAPTAMNCQEIEVYAFLKDGVYLYAPKENKLILVIEGDKRAVAGVQSFVAEAAVNLVYVSDMEKMKGEDEEHKMMMIAVDTGHVSENVYLYCASVDLACVVRAYVDAGAISKLLNLKDSQKVILSQSVGYKK
ncbi:MAG: SagB/ThcOx family dehydrogenase [Endomicrobium sp.]|jgi:SagB-type dehydrogenase family enzyme|nr:SagB/ThcOx family dehydrogenase [Endomicrobium sp.]